MCVLSHQLSISEHVDSDESLSFLPVTILIENVTKSRAVRSSFVHCWRPFHFAFEYQVPLIMPPSLYTVRQYMITSCGNIVCV